MEEQSETLAGAVDAGARPQVIYVMGAGRSGSTVLGVTLGNCEKVFFAGELNQWLLRAGVPTLDDDARVRFWREVRERVEVPPDLIGGKATWLERSSAILRPSRLMTRLRLRGRYRRVSEDLYHAVADVADVPCLVDTSHYPLRARQLQALRGIDLHLVFLTRDPQAVVRSLGREDVPERTFGVFTANAYLWLTNAFALIAFLRQPRNRRLFVRHEDFLADPQRVVARVLEHAGSQAPPPDTQRLTTGLPFHGNRLIRSPQISLERPSPASGSRSRATALLQLPWAIVFKLLRPDVRRAGAVASRDIDVYDADVAASPRAAK